MQIRVELLVLCEDRLDVESLHGRLECGADHGDALSKRIDFFTGLSGLDRQVELVQCDEELLAEIFDALLNQQRAVRLQPTATTD